MARNDADRMPGLVFVDPSLFRTFWIGVALIKPHIELTLAEGATLNKYYDGPPQCDFCPLRG
jgi:hypothetical protein